MRISQGDALDELYGIVHNYDTINAPETQSRVRELLTEHPRLFELPLNNIGRNAVHDLVCTGGFAMLDRAAAQVGVNYDTRDDNGMTPLWHLFHEMRYEHIIPLLERGANAASLDPQGRNAFQRLMHYDTLPKKDNQPTYALLACAFQTHGLDINAPGEHGECALKTANSIPDILNLLKAGADAYVHTAAPNRDELPDPDALTTSFLEMPGGDYHSRMKLAAHFRDTLTLFHSLSRLEQIPASLFVQDGVMTPNGNALISLRLLPRLLDAAHMGGMENLLGAYLQLPEYARKHIDIVSEERDFTSGREGSAVERYLREARSPELAR